MKTVSIQSNSKYFEYKFVVCLETAVSRRALQLLDITFSNKTSTEYVVQQFGYKSDSVSGVRRTLERPVGHQQPMETRLVRSRTGKVEKRIQ